MQQAGASVRSEYLGPVAPHPPWRPWLVSTKSRSMRDRQNLGYFIMHWNGNGRGDLAPLIETKYTYLTSNTLDTKEVKILWIQRQEVRPILCIS